MYYVFSTSYVYIQHTAIDASSIRLTSSPIDNPTPSLSENSKTNKKIYGQEQLSKTITLYSLA